MPKTKFDGVIEAVRYTPGGKIEFVRLYERRGAAWSDHVLVGRQELVERIKKGKRFVTGRRQPSLGGVFETETAVRLAGEGGSPVVVSEGASDGKDSLANVPVF
jgi:hypothetical protein